LPRRAAKSVTDTAASKRSSFNCAARANPENALDAFATRKPPPIRQRAPYPASYPR